MQAFAKFFLIVVIALGLTLPAQAQSRKELATKDAELEQRIMDIEQRYVTGDPAAERLMQRMDALESSQRALTGEIEQLRYERETLQAEIITLTDKIAVMESQASAPSYVQPAPSVVHPYQPQVYGGQPQIHNAEPQAFGEPEPQVLPQSSTPGTMGSSVVDMAELKRIGQDKLYAGDFTGAQLAFKQYIDLNPNAADISDAHFWLAETYFVKSGFSDAADNYIASMRAAPEGDKAPNALIGLAASMRQMGDKDGACQTLQTFAVQFPDIPEDIADKASIEKQRSGCA